MYRVNEFEDAIITALDGAGVKASPFSRKPVSDEFKKEVVTSPKVFVVFIGANISTPRTVLTKRILFSFHLFLIARNLRSKSSATRGDVATLGIYDLLDSVRNALEGTDLGLNIQPLRFIRESPFENSESQSIYRQEWALEIFE